MRLAGLEDLNKLVAEIALDRDAARETAMALEEELAAMTARAVQAEQRYVDLIEERISEGSDS
jgi:hypothetical protein